MRCAVALSLVVAATGGHVNDSSPEPPAPQPPVTVVPAVKRPGLEQAPAAPPVGAAWEAAKAARISYDRQKDEFVLTNVSGSVLWFAAETNGRGTSLERADPAYQRRTPGGWVT